jgi:hypothetical protein
VVHRDVEEALDLRRVQIDGQHAVGAGRRDHVGDELGVIGTRPSSLRSLRA